MSPEPDTPHIALVDDEEIVRDSLGILLSSLGNKVTGFEGGQPLLDQLRESTDSIDLVIMDWTMPEMSGRDLLLTLRKEFPNLAVVISTGHALDIGQLKTTLGVAPDSIIGKPFTRAAIQETIRLAVATKSE